MYIYRKKVESGLKNNMMSIYLYFPFRYIYVLCKRKQKSCMKETLFCDFVFMITHTCILFFIYATDC